MSQEENPNIIHVEDLNFHVMIPIPGHPHQLLGLSDVNLLSFVLKRKGRRLDLLPFSNALIRGFGLPQGSAKGALNVFCMVFPHPRLISSFLSLGSRGPGLPSYLEVSSL